MAKERVLITVRSYPTLLRKYGETVCTAGVRTDGTGCGFIRCRSDGLTKRSNTKSLTDRNKLHGRSDPRPETRHPADFSKMLPAGHMGTGDNWRGRRELLLNTAKVYDRLEPLMTGAKENRLSLAVFKPAKIRGFIWEDDEREWNESKVAQMREQTKQAQSLRRMPGGRRSRSSQAALCFSYQMEDGAGKRARCRFWIGNTASFTGIV